MGRGPPGPMGREAGGERFTAYSSRFFFSRSGTHGAETVDTTAMRAVTMGPWLERRERSSHPENSKNQQLTDPTRTIGGHLTQSTGRLRSIEGPMGVGAAAT
jgi:hypothetical protein